MSQNGGTLISEGLPGYFGDGAHAGATAAEPRTAAKSLARTEPDVDFTPDLLENLKFRVRGHEFGGRYFKQVYRPTTGKAIGNMPTAPSPPSRIISAKGRTILIGTFPGAAYFKKPNAGGARVLRKSCCREAAR